MLGPIPVIHGSEHGIGLMHREHRAFGKHVEVFVGYDRRNLDDEIGRRIEAGHFQIDPNEIFWGHHEHYAIENGMVAEQKPAKELISGQGLVLASYGRGVLVQGDGITLHCALTGRKQRIVCGDRVHWGYPPSSADEPRILSIEPRRNLIERIDARGRAEPVAANIDRLAIVVAAEPAPDWFLVDRYWAGAVLKDLGGLLVVNKLDLGTAAIQTEINTYRHLGLDCVEVSSDSGAGMDELKRSLAGSVTLLVGQSGVGKSTLVNTLSPEAAAQTAELTRDVEGRHTTTTARWYKIADNSVLIDAPGVRDFAPPASLVRAAERGFIEIHERSASCRFKDCRHLEEPGCAVRTAVVMQQIAARRYESYRRLFRLYEKLAS
jgi:ribosome biogenesis GTPase / thiamine phosphate phosphatase